MFTRAREQSMRRASWEALISSEKIRTAGRRPALLGHGGGLGEN
jgi:hypothetical protein